MSQSFFLYKPEVWHWPNIKELVIGMADAHVVPCDGERDPGGLLHDVAEVARELQRPEGRLVVAAGVADRGLDEQSAAACGRVGKYFINQKR